MLRKRWKGAGTSVCGIWSVDSKSSPRESRRMEGREGGGSYVEEVQEGTDPGRERDGSIDDMSDGDHVIKTIKLDLSSPQLTAQEQNEPERDFVQTLQPYE
ncbi:hypothetical protein J4E85_011086 [Alternaria conjuncta]|uniref:uncharacterized protein n=1 Tax=Alternaria conjuncta TaxID=181017 RepID=UPI00221FF03F|nr:uncharacterized protein J4E85_011086 [Alternaria conjuncta]KAI4912152.1 hypothetical protein J4E85_011086 [Alternaria conjuncta]